MTERDALNYLINLNSELRDTYLLYQNLLSAFKNKNKEDFIQILSSSHASISDYMTTSIRNLIEFKDMILNTFDKHSNFIEGNNNSIKVLKGTTFGIQFLSKIQG